MHARGDCFGQVMENWENWGVTKNRHFEPRWSARPASRHPVTTLGSTLRHWGSSWCQDLFAHGAEPLFEIIYASSPQCIFPFPSVIDVLVCGWISIAWVAWELGVKMRIMKENKCNKGFEGWSPHLPYSSGYVDVLCSNSTNKLNPFEVRLCLLSLL